MKKINPWLIYMCVIFIASCSGNKDQSNDGMMEGSKNLYGGVIRINETEKYQTLYPHAITDAVSASIAYQIYEGLVKFNPKDLSLQPCIAQKWEMDTSGTIYTFHLKEGVYFHDNLCFQNGKGREVKAGDFKYCYDLLCTESLNNSAFAGSFKDRVVGANKYYDSNKKEKITSGVEGIKVIDDHTLQIKLVAPDNSFMYILANPIAAVFPKEAVDMYNENAKVGTGPFIFDERSSSNQKTVLSRNAKYHRTDSLGNKFPYLDSVVISFMPGKKEELEAFKGGDLDLVIGLPSESVNDIVQKNIKKFKGDSAEYMLDRLPEMVTQYYEFNLSKPPFNNIKVRQAFNYAIDRNKLIDEILNGEAYGPGINGICPPAFKGYDITQIKGYDFDAAKAKKLLAEAGYPGGKGFPTIKLELNSGGQKNTNVAFEIQKQLIDVLNITIDIDVVPLAKKIEDAKYGRSEIFRTGWIADYPNPESFLCIVYGGSVPDAMDKPSFPNTSRYKNEEFDKLFESGKAAIDLKEGYDSYIKAEQRMMQDAPVIVLWYEDSYRLVRSTVKNFYNNPMRYKYYGEVYRSEIKRNADTEEK